MRKRIVQKLIAGLLVSAMIFNTAACGSEDNPSGDSRGGAVHPKLLMQAAGRRKVRNRSSLQRHRSLPRKLSRSRRLICLP